METFSGFHFPILAAAPRPFPPPRASTAGAVGAAGPRSRQRRGRGCNPKAFMSQKTSPGQKLGPLGGCLWVHPSVSPCPKAKGGIFLPFSPNTGSCEGRKRCTCPKGRACPAGGRPQGQQRLLASLRSILSALTQRACVQAGGEIYILVLKGRFAASQPAAVCVAQAKGDAPGRLCPAPAASCHGRERARSWKGLPEPWGHLRPLGLEARGAQPRL